MKRKQYAWSVRLSVMAGIALMFLAAFFAVPNVAKADEVTLREATTQRGISAPRYE